MKCQWRVYCENPVTHIVYVKKNTLRVTFNSYGPYLTCIAHAKGAERELYSNVEFSFLDLELLL